MQSVPKSERKRVSFFGRTNVGKSSLINALLEQKLSIVSPVPGTTTDPTEKAIEILPAGPLLFTDTAGLDDNTSLASERIKRTDEVLLKTDLAVFVFAPPFDNFEATFAKYEKPYIEKVSKLSIPYIFVVNKSDLNFKIPNILSETYGDNLKVVSCKNNSNIEELRAYIGVLLASSEEQTILGDIARCDDIFILVIPVHPAYPKGRLKPLQVQVIREILDRKAVAIETKPENLKMILNSLKKSPRLVICDATMLRDVAETVPTSIPLTTFSALFARYKGDLNIFMEGVKRLKTIEEHSRVAIIEACTHHRMERDMTKELLPAFIKEVAGKDFIYCFFSGTHPDLDRLKDVKLALHCGGCMLSRRDMQNRLTFLKENNIGVINYGMLVAMKEGLLERTIKPLI